MKRYPEVDNSKRAVLRVLSRAYERHAELEQLLMSRKEFEQATVEHGACVILLRAMVAEDVNPEPKGLE